MIPELRKAKLALTQEECFEIVRNSTSGVLVLQGLHEYPYPVPMSYAFYEGKLWFHGAKVGYKMDCMREHQKVAFCIISQDTVVPEKRDVNFESVNIFGEVELLIDETQQRKALDYLLARYSPGFEEEGEKDIINLWDSTATWVLTIDRITGKASREVQKESYGRG